MNKIININKSIQISKKLKSQDKRVVLAGGCFDLLHVGHITFLKKAKGAGDMLFVFLEADARIKKIKGGDRPINNQCDRAKILAALDSVDYIILLPPDFENQDYKNLVKKLRPSIIAITKGDPYKIQKTRQAKNIGARVIEVTDIISDKSTSRLIKLLGEDL